MRLYVYLAVLYLSQRSLISGHRFKDVCQSNEHLFAAIFCQIRVKLRIYRLVLLLIRQMRLEKFNFDYESIGAVQAQLSLTFSILHRLTKVQQALILPDVLNILLDEAELVQTHLQVIEEVSH